MALTVVNHEVQCSLLEYKHLPCPRGYAIKGSIPLPNDKFLDVTKLKAVADDELKVAKMTFISP